MDLSINANYLIIFRVLNTKGLCMGLDLVQTLITEATFPVVLIRALALEVHPFPVLELTTEPFYH